MIDIANETKPFNINTAGLGIFTGDYPVLFIPLVKTDKLITMHKKVWELFKSVGDGRSNYYHPGSWVPHISLAHTDLNKENIGNVMKYLTFENFNWEITVDNIAFIYKPTDSIGRLKYNFKFNK